MSRSLATLCLVICYSIVGENILLAQGSGSSSGRGLGNAASRAASVGRSAGRANAAMSQTVRPGNGRVNRVGTSAYRLPQAGAAGRRPVQARTASTTRTPSTLPGDRSALGKTTDNPQRILQQRMQQAEHLRAISQRNGNEALQQTADRMEASATTNFERQSMRLSAPNGEVIPHGEPTTDSEMQPVADPTAQPVTTAGPKAKAKTSATAKRGFWLRSR
ncbi:MAG: hypothetical protein ACO1RT_20900 [Planctomycetaceae bacterium]